MSRKNTIFKFTEFLVHFFLYFILITVVYFIFNIGVLFADYAYFGVNYFGDSFATSFNDIIFNRTCAGLKRFIKPKPAERIADIDENLDLNCVIPKTHIKGDNSAAFAKQITDDLTFRQCLNVSRQSGNVESYPMIIKVCKSREIGLKSLDNNMAADKVYAILPKINNIPETNYWFLSETLVQIYPPVNDTKYKGILTTNDIDSIKAALDLQMDYIDIEINRLKSKTIGNRRQIVAEINDYLQKTYLPDAYKTEIEEVFGNQNNQKNLDEYLAELIENFKRLTADNIIYKKDLDFFEQLYDKCCKIDTGSTEVARQSVCLYDMVYKNRRPYFDMLSLADEKFVPSHIMQYIIRQSELASDDIYAEYGKCLKIGDKTYPINKSGSIRLNPINSIGLNAANENLINEIYANIVHGKYVKYVNSTVFYIITAVFIAAFVIALSMHKRHFKWLVIAAEVLVTVIANFICAMLGYEFNMVSTAVLMIICVFMAMLSTAVLNGDNIGQSLNNEPQSQINKSADQENANHNNHQTDNI